MTLLKLRAEQQRQLFLITSGVSTAGSFAGITAKGWILMKGGVDPFVLDVELRRSFTSKLAGEWSSGGAHRPGGL